MKIQPVKKYKLPGYPEKAVVFSNPNLLKAVPERWKGNARIGIAMSSLAMMLLTSCGQARLQSGEPNGPGLNSSVERQLVAPLFVHGDGRGSFGCVSVAPPAFLSEEEAFQVVQEEAKNFKLDFQRDVKTLDGIKIPIADIYPDYSVEKKQDGNIELLNTKKGDLQLDGYDDKNRIGFEYISKDDFVSWHKEKGMMSSVESYDLLPAAETLRKGLEKNTEGNTVGIFYDPLGFSQSAYEEYSKKISDLHNNEKLTEEQRNTEYQKLDQNYQAELKQRATEELREQVKDFLNWLKAEGII